MKTLEFSVGLLAALFSQGERCGEEDLVSIVLWATGETEVGHY